MRIYVVKAGDTVDAIAASQNVPVDQLIWENQIEYPYRLAIGQALLLEMDRMPAGVPSIVLVTPILL